MVASLSIGALTTYTEIRRSRLCHEHVPALVEAAATIGAAQIQNRGTLGGNIANASPAGDTLPVLLAADAVFVLGSTRGEREVDAAEFWTGYRRTALLPDELVLRIRIPFVTDREMRFRKVGTRRAQSISKVVMSAAWRSTPALSRGPWRDVRVALGSVAATPVRARATEAALEGRAPNPETADLAAETLAGELSPIEDVRSTAEYRRLVAAADPAPHHSRGRRLVTATDAEAAHAAFIESMAPLFEGAPRFLRRLAAAGPFATTTSSSRGAREIAHAMPEAEQIELDRCAPAARGATRDGVGA